MVHFILPLYLYLMQSVGSRCFGNFPSGYKNLNENSKARSPITNLMIIFAKNKYFVTLQHYHHHILCPTTQHCAYKTSNLTMIFTILLNIKKLMVF